jgi:two-component system chemotaxis response regulator CheY
MAENPLPRILVIEDDLGYQELLVSVLSTSYDVSVCETVDSALQKIDAEKFDVVISDINLQDKSGLEILMRLQTTGRLKDCPVLLCSSQKDTDTKQLAQNMGAAGFIEKPFHVEPFLDEIRGLLRHAPAGGGPPRILVIEDDEGYQDLLSSTLAAYDVTVCGTMADAVRKIDSERFSLIISDINLQDQSGLELLMKLQVAGRLKECPVLLCSSQKDADTKQLAQNMGAAGFIEKPFHVEPFLDEIRTLLKSIP